jgi:hypothetical protein
MQCKSRFPWIESHQRRLLGADVHARYRQPPEFISPVASTMTFGSIGSPAVFAKGAMFPHIAGKGGCF